MLAAPAPVVTLAHNLLRQTRKVLRGYSAQKLVPRLSHGGEVSFSELSLVLGQARAALAQTMPEQKPGTKQPTPEEAAALRARLAEMIGRRAPPAPAQNYDAPAALSPPFKTGA